MLEGLRNDEHDDHFAAAEISWHANSFSESRKAVVLNSMLHRLGDCSARSANRELRITKVTTLIRL